MASARDLQWVYKKDALGNSYRVGQTVYQGQIFNYPPVFQDQSILLKNIHLMESRENDVWFISYPKSGQHWMHRNLNILASGVLEQTKVRNGERLMEKIASLERTEDKSTPTIHLTHLGSQFMPKDILEKQKIIYIIRNPKAVAASYFSHRVRGTIFEYDSTFAGFLPVFLYSDLDTCMGSWFDHVLGYWTKLKNMDNALILFYEDLLKDHVQTLQQISSFLGYPRTKAFCEGVAELTSLENMKIFEKQEAAESLPKDYWKSGQDGFVRTGKIDSWKSYFSEAQNEEFDRIYEKQMENYPDLKEKIKFE